jgi:hypothetical protein
MMMGYKISNHPRKIEKCWPRIGVAPELGTNPLFVLFAAAAVSFNCGRRIAGIGIRRRDR